MEGRVRDVIVVVVTISHCVAIGRGGCLVRGKGRHGGAGRGSCVGLPGSIPVVLHTMQHALQSYHVATAGEAGDIWTRVR